MSIDIVASHTLTAEEAERLTSRIRLLVGSVADTMGKLRDLVHEAKSSGAHDALGYASWSAYLLDLFGDEPLRLTRDVRRELVAELSEQGLSTRAIAPIVGVSKSQVAADLEVSSTGHLGDAPAPVDDVLAALDHEHESQRTLPAVITFDTQTGEVVDAPTVTETTETHTVKTVTGLDGKTYKTPAPREPKPVLAGNDLVQFDAEKNSKSLGDALSALYGITYPEHRHRLLTLWWPKGSGAVPPTLRELFTPAHLRDFADALLAFADELEDKS